MTESDWLDLSNPPATLKALLGEIGRVYAPFLLGNADAVARGAEQVECEVDGQPWQQVPFVYQAKCLRRLKEAYAALDAAARTSVDQLLDGTGCEVLFNDAETA